jgi:hypothetical protein
MTDSASCISVKRVRTSSAGDVEKDSSIPAAKRASTLASSLKKDDSTPYITAVKRALQGMVAKRDDQYCGEVDEFWRQTQMYPALSAHARDANVRSSIAEYMTQFGKFVDEALHLSNVIMAQGATITLMRWLTLSTLSANIYIRMEGMR